MAVNSLDAAVLLFFLSLLDEEPHSVLLGRASVFSLTAFLSVSAFPLLTHLTKLRSVPVTRALFGQFRLP